MNRVELIRWALKTSDAGFQALLADMSGDAALTQPTSKGGNHPLWVLGHLTFVEGIVTQILTGEPNPVAKWDKLFGTGTTPQPDAKLYPPFDELLATYRQTRQRTLKLLESAGDAGLDRKPENVPPGFEDAMQTVGTSLLLLTLHQMVHYGQVADARRVAGRKPLI